MHIWFGMHITETKENLMFLEIWCFSKFSAKSVLCGYLTLPPLVTKSCIRKTSHPIFKQSLWLAMQAAKDDYPVMFDTVAFDCKRRVSMKPNDRGRNLSMQHAGGFILDYILPLILHVCNTMYVLFRSIQSHSDIASNIHSVAWPWIYGSRHISGSLTSITDPKTQPRMTYIILATINAGGNNAMNHWIIACDPISLFFAEAVQCVVRPWYAQVKDVHVAFNIWCFLGRIHWVHCLL